MKIDLSPIYEDIRAQYTSPVRVEQRVFFIARAVALRIAERRLWTERARHGDIDPQRVEDHSGPGFGCEPLPVNGDLLDCLRSIRGVAALGKAELYFQDHPDHPAAMTWDECLTSLAHEGSHLSDLLATAYWRARAQGKDVESAVREQANDWMLDEAEHVDEHPGVLPYPRAKTVDTVPASQDW